MPKQSKRVAVVGGANVDIGGFPAGVLVPGDSNPGSVRLSVGGVGRNIAENLCRMGLETRLITAVGSDMNGRMLLEDCREKGIDTADVLVEADCASSVYLFVDDSKGDMVCAVNDMEIQSRLTPDRLAGKLARLNEMDAVVIDANLPEDTIAYLARELRVPLYADAVSAAKAARLRPALGRMAGLKPNRLEAELLTGVKINDMIDAAEAARLLMEAGVRRVFLSLGTQGALCAENGRCEYLTTVPRMMVNATGAGDAFTAALVWADIEGLDLRTSGIAGMAAASIAVASAAAVNPDMNREMLQRAMDDLAQRM